MSGDGERIRESPCGLQNKRALRTGADSTGVEKRGKRKKLRRRQVFQAGRKYHHFCDLKFSSKLLTLLVQPFLTYAMAEISDLGLSKILSQYANLLIPFVSMGMSNAIIRFGLDKGNSEKQVFTNGLLTILGGFGILVLCWPIAQFLPDMAQYGLLIYLYVLMSCLRTLCTQFVRSRQWNKLVAVDGVLCTVATMAFYALYLVGFRWGANGYLLAIISGDLVSVLFLCLTGKLWNLWS